MSSGIIGGFALSGFLAVAPVDQAYANPTDEAIKHAGKAAYKQFNIDDYVKTLEGKLLTKDMKKYGGVIGVSVRIITEQRVSYTWEF